MVETLFSGLTTPVKNTSQPRLNSSLTKVSMKIARDEYARNLQHYISTEIIRKSVYDITYQNSPKIRPQGTQDPAMMRRLKLTSLDLQNPLETQPSPRLQSKD